MQKVRQTTKASSMAIIKPTIDSRDNSCKCTNIDIQSTHKERSIEKARILASLGIPQPEELMDKKTSLRRGSFDRRGSFEKTKKLFSKVFHPSTHSSRCSSLKAPDFSEIEDLDFDIKEEYARDPDLYNLIQLRPWDPLDRNQYDDDAVYWYATNNPRSCRVRYDFDSQGRGKTNYFPLHRIVALGASLRTVEAVVRAYPPAVYRSAVSQHHHLFRTTVLHSACSFPSRFQAGVIQFLLDLNPSAVSQTQTNHKDSLPIHNACNAKNPSPIGLEAIQILVEAYPESLLVQNNQGETPLQVAKRNPDFVPDVLSYLEEIQREQQQ